MRPSFVLFLGLTANIPWSRAAIPLDVTFPDTPSASALMNVVNDNFLGISFELSPLDTLWGTSVNTMPSAIQNYLHNLVARMSNPLRIRIGGNSMDGSTYVPSLNTSMLVLSDPNAYFNDVPTNFGPVLFDVMNAMYDKVGALQFMIGLSMRDPTNDNVLVLAKAANEMLGERLDAMLLGNEPDLYRGHGNRVNYTIADYIPEIGDVVNELQSANLLQKPMLGGPTICCEWDLDDVVNDGLDKYSYKYYTVQHYPNNNCGGPSPSNTNMSYYLSHMNIEPYLGWQQTGVDQAKAAGIPVALTEYNSVSCGGSNISATFGAALWAVDVALKAASTNYSAVYMHTREYGVTYNLFDPPTAETSADTNWHTGSTYYSALFMSEAISADGSVVVDLNINNSNTSPHATVAAYGIYDAGGKSRGKLALLNYADQESQPFVIPKDMANSVQYRLLTAPDVLEKTDISWAGQTVKLNGALEGNQSTTITDCTNGCIIDVPGPGAALVILSDTMSERFFVGNSTLSNPTPLNSATNLALSSRYLGVVGLATAFSIWLLL